MSGFARLLLTALLKNGVWAFLALATWFGPAVVAKELTTPAIVGLKVNQLEVVHSDSLFSQSKSSIPSEPQGSIDQEKKSTSSPNYSAYRALLQVNIQKGWHIQSASPSDDFSIPTELKIQNAVLIKDLKWPQAKKKLVASLGTQSELYSHSFPLEVYLKSQAHTVQVSLNYQACNDTLCLPPAQSNLSINLPQGSHKSEPNSDISTHPDSKNIFQEKEAISSSSTTAQLQDEVTTPEDSLDFSGPWLGTLLLLLGGGFLLNLTPCVYPLLAITMSLFGGKAGSLTQKARLSSVFVGGLILSFSLLGLLAAFTGMLFGSFLQSSWVQLGIGLVFITLALSSYGLFELSLPSSFLTRVNQVSSGKKGILSLFVAGLFAGVLASPCIGPFVLGLIVYVGERQNVWEGFWMFTALGAGMGFPYLILGIFTSILGRIPKSGAWMLDVKKILALVLLGLANYYLRGFYSNSVYNIILAGLVMFGGMYINPFGAFEGVNKTWAAFLRLGALLALLIGLYIATKALQLDTSFNQGLAEVSDYSSVNSSSVNPPANSQAVQALNWQDFDHQKMKNALSSGQVALINFESKIWCAACREMEEKTYNQPSVIEKLQGNYALFKVDVDHHPQIDSLQTHFGVVGVPTLIVVGQAETELTRMVGFVNAQEFVKRLPKN